MILEEKHAQMHPNSMSMYNKIHMEVSSNIVRAYLYSIPLCSFKKMPL